MVVHHASTIAVIPQCEAGSILIDMYSMAKSLKPADRRRIVPADMQVEDSSLANDGFVGTVVAVGRDVRGETFIAGDYVGGYVNGGKWIETLDGSNKVYLNVRPDSLWPLSVVTAKEFGLVPPVTSDGCVIF